MKSLLFSVIAMLLTVPPVQAAALDLYAGAADVADQSAAERERAMPRALEQVLEKLSGLRNFEGRPDVADALEQASKLAVSFYYRNLPVPQSDGSTSQQLQLVVYFSREAVDDLVRRLELPVWEPERRPLTVWLVVDDELGRRIMPIELDYAWQHMARVAAERGLPVLRPQPDETGEYAVDVQLLWGGYTEELPHAGASVDALIVAALREGPEWNVRMNLDYGQRRWFWRERGIELDALLAEGMQQAVSQIAGAASIAATDLGRWSQAITVSGVADAADYVRCLTYLQGLSLVDGVGVLTATPGRVQLKLDLNALPRYLERSLEQDDVLRPTRIAHEYTLVPEQAANPPAAPGMTETAADAAAVPEAPRDDSPAGVSSNAGDDDE